MFYGLDDFQKPTTTTDFLRGMMNPRTSVMGPYPFGKRAAVENGTSVRRDVKRRRVGEEPDLT